MADEAVYGFERITMLLIEESHNIPFVMDDLPRNMGVGHVMHLTDGDEAMSNFKNGCNSFSGGSRIDPFHRRLQPEASATLHLGTKGAGV